MDLQARAHDSMTHSARLLVRPLAGPSVDLSCLDFFSPFYVVLSHFKSFYILSFSLDDRTRLRGVGLVLLSSLVNAMLYNDNSTLLSTA